MRRNRESLEKWKSSWETTRRFTPRRAAAILLALAFVFSACGTAAFAAESDYSDSQDQFEEVLIGTPDADIHSESEGNEPSDDGPDPEAPDLTPTQPEVQTAPDPVEVPDPAPEPDVPEGEPETYAEIAEDPEMAIIEGETNGGEAATSSSDRTVFSADELLSALQQTGSVKLGTDIHLTGLSAPIEIPQGQVFAIDLNSNTLFVSGRETEKPEERLSALFDIADRFTITDSSETQLGRIVADRAESIFKARGELASVSFFAGKLELAAGAGRGFLGDDGARLRIDGDIVRTEKCIQEAVDGGAAYLTGDGTRMQFTGKILNTEGKNGGAVYAADGAVLETDAEAEISGCSATEDGGALYGTHKSVIRISGLDARNNSAARNGGAVASDGTVELTGGKFSGNIALDGGAVWIGEKGVLSADAASSDVLEIAGNTAENEGGGIWLAQTATASLGGYAEVSGNTADGSPGDMFPASKEIGDSFYVQNPEEPEEPTDAAGTSAPGDKEPDEQPTEDPDPDTVQKPSESGKPSGTQGEEATEVPGGEATQEPSENPAEPESPTTFAQLREMLEKGGATVLKDDIEEELDPDKAAPIGIEAGTESVLILNGHSVRIIGKSTDDLFEITGGKLVVKNVPGTGSAEVPAVPSIHYERGSNMFRVTDGGTLEITDTELSFDSSVERAVFASNGSSVSIDGGSITGPGTKTAEYGGAVFADGSGQPNASTSVVIKDTEVSGTSATHGGAVGILDATVRLEEGTIISGCDAAASELARAANGVGGAVFISSGELGMVGADLEDCSAASSGGAIYMEGGSAEIRSGTISGCQALSGSGGGVAVQGGTIKMTGGTIDNCEANGNGGAVYVGEQGSIEMDAASDNPVKISTNKAGGLGGGMYLAPGATATLKGSADITGNTAGENEDAADLYSVGPIAVPATFTVARTNAAVTAAGEYVTVNSVAELKSALDAGNSVRLGTDIILSAADFKTVPKSNPPTAAGLIVAKSLRIDLNGHTLSGNALGHSFGSNVSVYLIQVAEGALTIEDNSGGTQGTVTYENGDAIFCVARSSGSDPVNASLNLEAGTIQISSTINQAVFVEAAGTLSMTGPNVVIQGAEKARRASIWARGILNISAGTIRGVKGAPEAGAIQLFGNAKLYFSGTACIEDCEALYGAAVGCRETGNVGPLTVEVTGGTIRNCHATGQLGGAIYLPTEVETSSLKISGLTMQNCYAAGVTASLIGSVIRVRNCNVSIDTSGGMSWAGANDVSIATCNDIIRLDKNCTAQVTGNGTLSVQGADNVINAAVSGDTITMADSPTIEVSGNNTNRVFFAANGATLTMPSGKLVRKNGTATGVSGGAILAAGTVNLSGGEIKGFSVTSSGEATAVYGGGIAIIATGQLNMSGGTISDCTSSGNGAGIAVVRGSKMTMTGGTITGCTSTGGSGGGIYFDAAASQGNDFGSLTLNATTAPGITITDNSSSAGKAGGGIFVYGYSSDTERSGAVTLKGYANVTGNKPADVRYCNVYPKACVALIEGPDFVIDKNGLSENADRLAEDVTEYFKAHPDQSVFVVSKTYDQSQAFKVTVSDFPAAKYPQGITLRFTDTGKIIGGDEPDEEQTTAPGPVIVVDTGMKLTIDGSAKGRIEANFPDQKSVIEVEGELVLDGPEINGGNDPENDLLLDRGGLVETGIVVKGGSFTMRSGTISNCGTTEVKPANSGTVGTEIPGSQGGGLRLDGGSASISGGRFYRNTGQRGAAIFVSPASGTAAAGSLTIGDAVFEENGNAWTDYGGAVAADSGASLTINGARFRNNRARWGGAVAIVTNWAGPGHNLPWPNLAARSADFNISNTYIGNDEPFEVQTLSEEGGASIDIAEKNEGGNIATYGGGLYIDISNKSIDITNTTIQSNSAGAGGGMYIHTGTVNLGQDAIVLRNGAVAGNSKPQEVNADKYEHQWPGNGGGIYVGEKAALNMTDNALVIRNATTRQEEIENFDSKWPGDGGGVYLEGTANIGGTSVIRANFSMGQGGGIYMTKDGKLNFEDHEPPNDKAIDPETQTRADTTNVAVLYNRESGTMDSFGTTEETREARILRNVRYEEGATLKPEVADPNDWFSGWRNFVGGASNAKRGPVLHGILETVGDKGTIDLARCLQDMQNPESELYRRVYDYLRSPGGYGYSEEDAKSAIENSVKGKTLYVMGFNVIGDNAEITLDLNGCTIDAGNLDLEGSSQNTLFRVMSGAKFTIKDSSADNSGCIQRTGPLLNSLIQVRPGGSFVLEGGTLRNGGNHAIRSEGGDIMITGNAKITESGNGREPGGGVMVVQGPAGEDGKVEFPGRLQISGNAEFTRNFGTFGGAVYSTAGNGTFITSDNVLIEDNTGRSGGGIWAKDLVMHGGTIKDNTALWGGSRTGQGGGMFVAGNVLITRGRILNNRARNVGGGIYVTWGTQCTIDGNGVGAVQIQGNKAEDSMYDSLDETHAFAGGGIFLEHNLRDPKGDDAGNLTILRIYDAYIHDNKAAYAGGVGTCRLGSTQVQQIDGPTICNNDLMDATLPTGYTMCRQKVKNASDDIMCDGLGKIHLPMISEEGGPAQYASWAGMGYNAKDGFDAANTDPQAYTAGSLIFNAENLEQAAAEGADASDAECDYARFGLKNSVSDEAIRIAENNATCVISENVSRTGAGGIGGNGTMILGRTESSEGTDPANVSFDFDKEAWEGPAEPYMFTGQDSFTFKLQGQNLQTDGKKWETADADYEGWRAVKCTVIPPKDTSEFTQATPLLQFSAPGVYSYILSETETSVENMSADPAKYWFDISVGAGYATETGRTSLKAQSIDIYRVVNDSKTGKPMAGEYLGSYRLVFNEGTGSWEPATALDFFDPNTTFVNSIGAKYVPKVTKNVQGGDSSGLSFRFRIAAAEGPSGGNPMPEKTDLTLRGNQIGDFGAITYYASAVPNGETTYRYTITEVNEGSSHPGWHYDTAVWTLEVPVKKENGIVSIDEGKVTYTHAGGTPVSGKDASAVFTNRFNPDSDLTSFIPGVRKTVEGMDAQEASRHTFRFELTALEGAPMPAGGSSVAITGIGSAQFGSIQFTRPGTYTYSIREIAESDSGIQYDQTIWTLAVPVLDAGGGKVTVDTQNVRYTANTDGSAADSAQFTNRASGIPSLPPPGTLPTPTPTPTPTATLSPAPTPTLTAEPSPSATPTSSVTPTASVPPVPSVTPATSVEPTGSVTPEPSGTRTPTASASLWPFETPGPEQSVMPFEPDMFLPGTPDEDTQAEMPDFPDFPGTATPTNWVLNVSPRPGSTPTSPQYNAYSPNNPANRSASSPKTGDQERSLGWIMLAAAAICLVGAISVLLHERRSSRDAR